MAAAEARAAAAVPGLRQRRRRRRWRCFRHDPCITATFSGHARLETRAFIPACCHPRLRNRQTARCASPVHGAHGVPARSLVQFYLQDDHRAQEALAQSPPRTRSAVDINGGVRPSFPAGDRRVALTEVPRARVCQGWQAQRACGNLTCGYT